ncbi:hypothetical protein A33Q_1910 [Indibacter alkaliphilus LW1]|uniref:Uncharacterized protein n=1 Tax=Indibacter alkaliphilus (strain CCUG 57479 / KCTC 22604 / LW1) TaxID=1189612 RepID=S2DCU7_INDAL|nr:hypothetical protein A33Q_1910 [Indibacter alkaliphilus LW1]
MQVKLGTNVRYSSWIRIKNPSLVILGHYLGQATVLIEFLSWRL